MPGDYRQVTELQQGYELQTLCKTILLVWRSLCVLISQDLQSLEWNFFLEPRGYGIVFCVLARRPKGFYCHYYWEFLLPYLNLNFG